MGHRRHEFDSRILTVFLLASIPFVAFGAYLVVSLARGRLEDSLGESLEQRALQIPAGTDVLPFIPDSDRMSSGNFSALTSATASSWAMSCKKFSMMLIAVR